MKFCACRQFLIFNTLGDPFTVDSAAAEAFIFFLGGFETSASALQFTFYELAKNQEIQDKVRQEIVDELARSGGKMTYEGLFGLKYMGMVIEGKCETVIIKINSLCTYLPTYVLKVKENSKIRTTIVRS